MTDFPAPVRIPANGIRLATYSQGEGPPVIFCHGFPEIAYSWRHQLPALAAAGYSATAVDLRGYGLSDKPTAVDAYSSEVLCADLIGLLDGLDLSSAVFVGHDWGAMLLWEFVQRHPDRVSGLVNLNIPYYRRPPSDPVEFMREHLGPEHYIVDFNDSDRADHLFDSDPAKFLRSVFRRLPVTRERYEQSGGSPRPYSMLAGLSKTTWPGDELLNESELAVFVEAFARGGFSGPINWYRNWSANWRASCALATQIETPTLFIGANDDVLVQPRHIEAMHSHISDLEIAVLPDCGHWTQQERPQAVNKLIIDWLERH